MERQGNKESPGKSQVLGHHRVQPRVKSRSTRGRQYMLNFLGESRGGKRRKKKNRSMIIFKNLGFLSVLNLVIFLKSLVFYSIKVK